MGLWNSYWEWVFSDEESFTDLERGIFYRASGKTRSVKGLFSNFNLQQQLAEGLGLSSSQPPQLEDKRKYIEDNGIRIYNDKTVSCKHGNHKSICKGCMMKLLDQREIEEEDD